MTRMFRTVRQVTAPGAKSAVSDCILLRCALLSVIFNACNGQILRYNDLLDEIRLQLTALERGIKGFVVMSSDLEEVFQCIYDARVPSSWQKVRAQVSSAIASSYFLFGFVTSSDG